MEPNERENLSLMFGQRLSDSFRTEVRVTFDGLVLVKKDNKFVLEEKKFGYLNYDKIIYNARCENVESKVLFRDEFRTSRCIVFANGFYEPDKRGNDHIFLSGNQDLLYMAGIVKKNNFIILTCNSSPVVKYYHPRMPLCLRKEDIPLYMDTKNGSFLFDIVKLPEIVSPEESEQMTLF